MSDLTNCIEKLRVWRDNNDRRSREITEMWQNTLQFSVEKLGKEKLVILEQVCVAALDSSNLDVARVCIKRLLIEFPQSLRVKKYEAMIYEADEQYDNALKILDSIIKKDETNSAARERKVAILKAEGKNTEAIKELCDYLKIFMADTEAWQELSELYITEQDFNKAAFCVEELILHNPYNHLLHQRYADIRYTQGGTENLELAKAYYCQALKLNPINLRALFGLHLTLSNIISSQKCTAQKKKDTQKLLDWTSSELRKYYSKKDPQLADRLAALQIA